MESAGFTVIRYRCETLTDVSVYAAKQVDLFFWNGEIEILK